MPEFDVVGVGLNATDTLLIVPHFPAYAGKVPFQEEIISPGGQVASAMVCCARLGLRTKYIGTIGDDSRGRIQMESLRTSGINLDHVQTRHCPNQSAYIIIDRSTGERTVLWRREDELTQSPQGPAMSIALEAGLDVDGRIVHWQHEVWSPGHSRRPGRSATPALLGAWQTANPFAPPASIDMPLASGGGAERNAVPGYDFGSQRVLCHSVVTRRRSSALRSLGAFGNVFAAESFIDEIAHVPGQLAHEEPGTALSWPAYPSRRPS